MNQDKIGKFIAELRKNKKLTQTELAKRIGVSNKTVSKWECGNAIPDYGVFENLCKEFNISVNELLNGEKDMKDDKVIGEYMKMKGKQNCLKILVVLIISILVILCVIFGTYFFNSYKSITMYEFVGENENFGYKNATYLESKIKTVFTGGQLTINNPTITESDILDKRLAIKDNDKYYSFGNVYPGSLSYEDYLYGDKFSIAELRHLPNDLYLIVWYKFDGEILYDVIELKSKLILSNDKLVDFKTEHIAEVPEKELNNEINFNKYDSSNEYKDFLVDNGFKVSDKCNDSNVDCGVLVKSIEDEKIYINYIDKAFWYENKGEYKCYSRPHIYGVINDDEKIFDGDIAITIYIYEIVKTGEVFPVTHRYNLKDKTIDYKKINKDNEKYMKYFNRFIELYDMYRPQDE